MGMGMGTHPEEQVIRSESVFIYICDRIPGEGNGWGMAGHRLTCLLLLLLCLLRTLLLIVYAFRLLTLETTGSRQDSYSELKIDEGL